MKNSTKKITAHMRHEDDVQMIGNFPERMIQPIVQFLANQGAVSIDVTPMRVEEKKIQCSLIDKFIGPAYACIDFIDKAWTYEEDIFDDDTLEEGWIELGPNGFKIGSDTSHTIPEDIITLLEENFIRYELSK